MKIVDVVCGVLRHPETRDILMVKKAMGLGTPIDGEWHLPGGKVDWDDDFNREDALQREFHEETGVWIDVGEPIGVAPPSRSGEDEYFGVYYAVELYRPDSLALLGRNLPPEITDIRWFTWAEAQTWMGPTSKSYLPLDFWERVTP